MLDRVERKIMIDDAARYSRVGVRWYGNGTFLRDHPLGSDIARKQQWIIKAGDVVYNKLFAWKGAFAVADGAVDGHIVSDKFPTYTIDEGIVDPRFLAQYFRTYQLAFQAGQLSKGAAAISKLTLNPPQFWDLTIPLPPLAEQQSLVRLLDQAQLKVEAAKKCSRDSAAESAALEASIIGERFADFPANGRLFDVLSEKPRNGWSAPCDNTEGGTPVLSLGAVTGFVYRPGEHKLTSEATDPDRHYWLEPGDLLMTRSNTESLLGHTAIYDGSPSPCIYPDLMMKLKVDHTLADTRFVYYWLRTPGIRSRIQRAGKGTNTSMKKITQKVVMDLPFPTEVGLDEQRDLVAELDSAMARVEQLRLRQQEVHADLSALIPSMLDHAFCGALDIAGDVSATSAVYS